MRPLSFSKEHSASRWASLPFPAPIVPMEGLASPSRRLQTGGRVGPILGRPSGSESSGSEGNAVSETVAASRRKWEETELIPPVDFPKRPAAPAARRGNGRRSPVECKAYSTRLGRLWRWRGNLIVSDPPRPGGAPPPHGGMRRWPVEFSCSSTGTACLRKPRHPPPRSFSQTPPSSASLRAQIAGFDPPIKKSKIISPRPVIRW